MASITDRLDDAIDEAQGMCQDISQGLDNIDTLPESQALGRLDDLERRNSSLQEKVRRMEDDTRRVPINARDYYEQEVAELKEQSNGFAQRIREKKSSMGEPTVAPTQQQQTGAQIHENLTAAIAVSKDTEATNEQTKATLQDDRQRLNNIDNNLTEVDEEAVTGTVRAKRIIRRIICHNVIAWIVCGVLFAIFIVIVACKGAKKWPGW